MLRAALVTLAVTILAGPAAAQVLPVAVPAGKIRIDFTGRFESFDRRWNDGSKEEWAGDFDGLALDRTSVPSLAGTEARLRQITGLTDISLALGRTSATQLVNLGTMGFGAAVGVTRWLTVFGTVPFVRVKARTRVTVDTTGSTAGLNPADPVLGDATGRAQAMAFFDELATAIAALRARLDAGDFDGDPARKSLAQQTLARAMALEMELFALLQEPETASSFLPRSGTAVANTLTQIIRDLQGTLSTAFGITTFGTLPPLPESGLDDAGLAGYLTAPGGPIAAEPFDAVPEITYVGDIELGAVVSLLDRFAVGRSGHGIRAALEATVRLPTAQLDSPDRFLDIGTGDRQPDIEVAVVSDLGFGRVGVRLDAGYRLQLPGNLERRVAPAAQLAPAATLATVRRDPGDVVRLGARPFVRLAPHLMLGGSVEYRRKGTDAYTYGAGLPQADGAALSPLATGSRSDALLVGAGLTFSHSGRDRNGALRLPLDAAIRYHRVASSTMGHVADSYVVQVDLRLYGRVW